MHMHGTIKNNTITHIWIQIIPCLSHRYIHEFYSFFLLYLFYFLDIHMSLLFFIRFFLWFIYIRLFVICTTLNHLEILKKYIDRTHSVKLNNN